MSRPLSMVLLCLGLLLAGCSGTSITVKSVLYETPSGNTAILRLGSITQSESFSAAPVTEDLRRFLRFALENRGFRISTDTNTTDGLTLQARIQASRFDSGMEEKHSAVIDILLLASGKPVLNIMTLYESGNPLVGGRRLMRICETIGDTVKKILHKKN